MGLFFSYVHRSGERPELFEDLYACGGEDDKPLDACFNKPRFYQDETLDKFLGLRFEQEEDRWGAKFVGVDWRGVQRRAASLLVCRLTERLYQADGHICHCPECLRNDLDDLRRLLLLCEHALDSGEPDNYGFGWSP